MKFIYEQSKTITSELKHIDKTETIAKHALAQTFGENIHGNIGYLLTHELVGIAKSTNEQILNFSIAYKYSITEVNSISDNFIEQVINDSLERLSDDYFKFLGDHFLSELELTVYPDYQHYTNQFNGYISQTLN